MRAAAAAPNTLHPQGVGRDCKDAKAPTITLNGRTPSAIKVSWQNEQQLRFVLREGKKRQIRRMCELVGLKVVGLKRVRMGRIPLGDLPVGQWRYLHPMESFL